MSVINKMLRDLDSRQTTATPVNSALNQGRGMARGTAVLMPAVSPRKVGWMTFAAVALVLAGLAGGLVVWWQVQGVPKTPSQAQAVITPSAPATPKPPVMVSPEVVPTAVLPASVVTPNLAPAAPAPAPVAAALPVIAKAPVSAPKLRASSAMAMRPGVDVPAHSNQTPLTTAPPVALTASAPLPAAASQRQSAALDALAQAQGLWAAGARDTATEVLREALALAERQGASASSAVVPLAREMARVLMAQNQNAQALDLLIRLEPAMSGQADLWAVRGNAAQRLGRHPEAANAYLTALKIRPGEPRWMLGAAISQAIQGQMTEATELTEQARAKGALSAELRAYLRQLGVVIRDN